MTEINLDRVEDEIARLSKPKSAADSPLLLAACGEFIDLRQRYHRAFLSVRDLQKGLRRTADRWEHRLLGTFPDNAFTELGQPIDMSASRWPPFDSAQEARSAVQALLPRVLDLEGRAAQLSAAAYNEPEDKQNRRLIRALLDRVQALEQRVSELTTKQRKATR